jgi:predicted transcriptional regulator
MLLRLTIGTPMCDHIGMPKHIAPDWATLLREMAEVPMTQAEIADAVKLSQPSVSDLMSGKVKTTEFSRGQRIIAAHRSAMRRKVAAKAEV